MYIVHLHTQTYERERERVLLLVIYTIYKYTPKREEILTSQVHLILSKNKIFTTPMYIEKYINHPSVMLFKYNLMITENKVQV